VNTALLTLDMRGADEATIALRLDGEIPAAVVSGARYVILDLGARPALRRVTAEQVVLAHREMRAVDGRLVVVGTPRAANDCVRLCPELLVAATVRQAQAALGLPEYLTAA
jgi:hypothetical protein